MDSRVQAPVMDNRVFGVAGHEQNLEIGPFADRLIGKLAAVDATRHHDVSQQKIHSLIAVENLKRQCAVARFQNPVAEFAQYVFGVFPQFIVVFDDEDGLYADRPGDVARLVRSWLIVVAQTPGKVDLDRRAHARFAVDLDVPGRLSGEAIDLT